MAESAVGLNFKSAVEDSVGVSSSATGTRATLTPPTSFDKDGAPKKMSPTELSKLKGSTRLPGYAVDAASVQKGQIVEVYAPRSAAVAPKKAPAPPAKKGFIGDDPNLAAGIVDAPPTEAYLILIILEK